jgi:hypothetical protein
MPVNPYESPQTPNTPPPISADSRPWFMRSFHPGTLLIVLSLAGLLIAGFTRALLMHYGILPAPK